MTIPHPKEILESWSALVGIWGSSYFALLEAIDAEIASAAESLEWPFVIIGLAGLYIGYGDFARRCRKSIWSGPFPPGVIQGLWTKGNLISYF